MALFRYLRPVGKALDPQGPLLEVVPSAVIREVNLEVQKAGGPMVITPLLRRKNEQTEEIRRGMCPTVCPLLITATANGSALFPISRWHGSSSPTLASQMSL